MALSVRCGGNYSGRRRAAHRLLRTWRQETQERGRSLVLVRSQAGAWDREALSLRRRSYFLASGRSSFGVGSPRSKSVRFAIVTRAICSRAVAVKKAWWAVMRTLGKVA